MTAHILPDWLSEPQRRAILSPAPRLQIVAGAGSGKTEVLARRVVRLLVEGVDPASIIAFTFTEKAAAELKARIETRAAEADERFRELPPVGRGLFIGTTHGWALRALQELGGAYELCDALTEEQEWALVYRVARRLGVVDLYAEHVGPGGKVAVAPAVSLFLRSAEVVHNERLDRETVREVAPRFAEVLERYEWLLGEMRLTPFRLMIARAADELAPGGRLHERLRGRVAHVFVDEYQDFNRAQEALLERLAALGAAVTVVGDDDQAIYQWRGGDVSLFLSFGQRFPGAEGVELGENHRCRPEIVDFARVLAESLARRLPKQLTAAREPAPPGAVELFVATTPEKEAETIAARIEQLIEAGHAPGDVAVLYRSTRTSARPLVDALRARGIPVQVVGHGSLLARPEMAVVARIFVYWAGGTWYPNREGRAEVVRREALETEIRAVTGMDAERACEALDALERLGDRLRREGVPDIVAVFNEILAILGLPGRGDQAAAREPGLGQMSELLTAFDHVARRAAPDALYSETTGPGAAEGAEDAMLAADREDGALGPLLGAGTAEAVHRTSGPLLGAGPSDTAFAAGPPNAALGTGPAAPAFGATRPDLVLGATRGEIYLVRLRAFLEEFAGRAAEEAPAEWEQTAGAVQVLTIHQSKGLEFSIVFVPSLVEGRLPSSRLGRPQEWYLPDTLFDRARYEGEEDDEARLLYVALTRAKELLVVSWFEQYQENRRAAVSRFLTGALRPALGGVRRFGDVAPAATAGPGVRTEPPTLDFSSLVTYAECGYRYRLRHVCGFQPLLARELGFGKLLHHLVAELARAGAAGRRAEPGDVARLLERSFYLPLAGREARAALRESARRRVEAYVCRHGDELLRTIWPEARFEVPLAAARVRGRIDLLLRAEEDGNGARVELVDFKTTSNRPPEEMHVNQLRLYAAAAEAMGLEPVRLAIHDLDADGGARQPVPQDDAAREAFRERLEAWAEGIRTGRFEPPENREVVCRGCDFRQFCRYAG